ncbi:MAG: prolyl oligopeptidase family serine peptidase [Pirellulaceae bacterium]|nr:prolyl oligopeptidase family serine peptidase [Pirellulaceae bacterium]
MKPRCLFSRLPAPYQRLPLGRLTLCILFCLNSNSFAQQVLIDAENYLQPSEVLKKSVLAPWHKNVTFSNQSPNGTTFLLPVKDGMPSLKLLASPKVILAETTLDPKAIRKWSLSSRNDVGYELYQTETGKKVSVKIPEGARVSGARWSPSGDHLAFYVLTPDATHIYLTDSKTGKTSQLTTIPVVASHVASFQFTHDGKHISTVLRHDPKGELYPHMPAVAPSPTLRLTRRGKTPARTFRFLLQTPHDKDLLEYLSTGQLALIEVATGKITNVGKPAMFLKVDMAPNGQYFRTTKMRRPFSYHSPMQSFGNVEELIDIEGKVLKTLSEKELKEPTIANDAKATPKPQKDEKKPDEEGDKEAPKRSLTWRVDGNGLSFLQKEPTPAPKKKESDDQNSGDLKEEGDDKSSAKKPVLKDRVMHWLPPFGKDDIKILYASETAINNVQYSDDAQTLFLTQTIEGRRTITVVDLKNPTETNVIFKAKPRENGKKESEDKKDGPKDDKKKDSQDSKDQEKRVGVSRGRLMTQIGPSGLPVVRISSDGEVYFQGDEPAPKKEEESKEGGSEEIALAKPYIEKVEIKSGTVTRLFTGDGTMLEKILATGGNNITEVYTSRELKTVVPDSYVYNLEKKSRTKLTNNVNYTPWFGKLVTERFRVERVDGKQFWVKVTKNPDHGNKLPAMFWFYPREYESQEAYDRSANRSRGNSQRFAKPSNRAMAHLTQIGYVIVEPDIPIFGEAGAINNNFIQDLRNGLWAVIDELDRREIADRDRLGLGGHSYGAFGTANAMAHTPFFKAGIAGDGNYNRTLTPLSFQSERRYIWDAKEVYLGLSPFLSANKINGALLMYHGIDDTNVGTFPINSERMFHALDGLGKPAALYMYPYEAHGPAAQETIVDMWARWEYWLNKYVKNYKRPNPNK